MKTIQAQYAWLGGESCAENVQISFENGIISAIEVDVTPDANHLAVKGVLMPGFVNAHSHAFHRALRGRTHNGIGLENFWQWRTLMYQIANNLNPENYLALATAVFTEMALAGITTVGEFHYIHHQPNGKHYADPNEIGRVVIEAARLAGIRLSLLDVVYLHGGLNGEPLNNIQQRFNDSSIEKWFERVDLLGAGNQMHSIGLAPHSVRAVHQSELSQIAAQRRNRVVHVHVSEQVKENEICRKATGKSPTKILADAGLLGSFATAVHATHLDTADIALLGSSNTTVCFCPTTESDLADGVGPSSQLVGAGAPLALGTDSHAMIDMFQEARAVELNQRLLTKTRGVHLSRDLLTAATINGAKSLGTDNYGLTVGAPADFIAVSTDSVSMASFDPLHGAGHLVFAANASDVRDVWVAGNQIVANYVHCKLPNCVDDLRAAISSVV